MKTDLVERLVANGSNECLEAAAEIRRLSLILNDIVNQADRIGSACQDIEQLGVRANVAPHVYVGEEVAAKLDALGEGANDQAYREQTSAYAKNLRKAFGASVPSIVDLINRPLPNGE